MTTSIGLVAFKALNGSGKTVIGYVEIDEFKRRSKSVAEDDKPKATLAGTEPSDADPRSVEAVLTGQWRPSRFVAGGQDMPDDAMDALRLTFAAGNT